MSMFAHLRFIQPLPVPRVTAPEIGGSIGETNDLNGTADQKRGRPGRIDWLTRRMTCELPR